MHRAVHSPRLSRLCLTLAFAASAALAACSPSAGSSGGAGGSSGMDPAPARPDPETPKPPVTPPPSNPPPSTPPSTTGNPPVDPTPIPPPAPDAAPPAPEADASAPGPATDAEPSPPPPPPSTGPEDPKAFDCTLVIGIAATGQWFGSGFEKIVPNEKWELLSVHSGFIQYWADPANAFWGKAPSSACTTNAKTPDRVILEALYLHWMDATVDQWMTVLDQTVKTFKAKNPNLKRLEFSTFVRAPGDKPCPASMPFKSWIRPEQDEAYQKIAAMYPGFVTVAPKFKVASCADYGGNPPHFTTGGANAAAKLIGDHYAGTTTATP